MSRAAEVARLKACMLGSMRRKNLGKLWFEQCAEVIAEPAKPSDIDYAAAGAAIRVGQNLRRLVLAAGFAA